MTEKASKHHTIHSCAEDSSYFELFFDQLLAHFTKLMEAYQAAEEEK